MGEGVKNNSLEALISICWILLPSARVHLYVLLLYLHIVCDLQVQFSPLGTYLKTCAISFPQFRKKKGKVALIFDRKWHNF